MTRCLVLVLVSWWSVLVAHSLQCETGVAFVDSILSVPRSLMANADVAVLKSYNASSVKQCMEDCCAGKYGACSVATFKKNFTTENCILFNCRPLSKCKFLSSASTTSFSFSTNPTSIKPPVPSEHHHSSTSSTSAPTHQSPTEEDIPVEQFALKNDNTTVKPRKGVDEPIPGDEFSKSGIKPRKGVNFDDVPHSQFLSNSHKSNVKARKGVGPYSTTVESSSPGPQTFSSVVTDYPVTPTPHDYSTPVTEDMLADLAKILADDSDSSPVTLASTYEVVASTPSWSPMTTTQSTGVPLFSSVLSSSRYTPESSSSRTPPMWTSSKAPPMWTSTRPVLRQTTSLWPADATTIVSVTPTRRWPTLVTQTLNAEYTRVQEQEVAMDKLLSTEEEEETENDRKYKSSIHLVLSLVFGLLVLFAVLGVVAKRVYDGWLRRDYYRMNYLIDGIYNGVE